VIHSSPGVRSDLFNRPLSETLLTDFFGGVSEVEVLEPVVASGVEEETGAVVVEESRRPNQRRKRRREGEETVRREGEKGKTTQTLAVAGGVVGVHLVALYVASQRRSRAS
jgi:phosphatidylinositol glycan class K